MRSLVVAALVVAGSCVACGGANYGTPRPSDGPAFAAASRASTEVCGHDVCVSQGVVNMGNRAGSGACRLDKIDRVGGYEVVSGPTVRLPIVAPGATTTVVARWTGTVDKGNVFTFTCDPPPLM